MTDTTTTLSDKQTREQLLADAQRGPRPKFASLFMSPDDPRARAADAASRHYDQMSRAINERVRRITTEVL